MKKNYFQRFLSVLLSLLAVVSLVVDAPEADAAESSVNFEYSYGPWDGEKCGTYKGEVSGSKPSGTGKLSFDYGGTYSGSFQNGYPSGYGTYTYANGKKISGTFAWTKGDNYVFEAPEKGNSPHYNGTDVVYVGMTMNGEPCGFGTLDFEDGGTFYGEFKDCIVQGKGVYVYLEPNGKDYISGSKWKLVSRTSSSLGGRWYSGLILDGTWQGYGMLCYNYSYYIGEVLDNYCSGHGTYWQWSDKGDPSGTLTQKDFGHYKEGKMVYTCNHKSKDEPNPDSNLAPSPSPSPSKQCSSCNGWGSCNRCGGSGDCRTCRGSGTKPCPSSWCSGGHCAKCTNGYAPNGKVCSYCHGDNICNTCFGRGTRQCITCSGDGDCNFCYGSGDCHICGGDGYL